MPELFVHLMEMTIKPGLCLGCGTCVASCPFNSLELVEGRPTMKRRCGVCGICFAQCPRVAKTEELVEKIFEGAAPTGTLGVVQQAFSAQSTDVEIRARAQDGGVITALLSALLEVGFIDGAVVTGTGDLPWLPAPKVATTRGELLECAGSKYSRGPLLLGLRDAVELYACERIAIVGLPCQVWAMRRMQTSELAIHRLSDTIKLTIGLFCTRAYSYEGLFKRVVEKQLDVPLAEVAKFDIKRKQFLIYRRRKPKRELTLEALERFADAQCKICPDFAAELADISVGAVGSPLGWSTVFLRTQVGVEAFEQVRKLRAIDVKSLNQVKPGIKAIERLSSEKKQAAAQEIERRRKSGKPLPLGFQKMVLAEASP